MASKVVGSLWHGPFEWPVPVDGFCWVEATDVGARRPGRYLVPSELVRQPSGAEPTGPTATERRYDPTGERVLFLRFAKLEPTETAVQAFASQHGTLGAPEDGLGNVVDLDNCVPVAASPLNLWKQEVWEMRRAVDLWEALQGDGVPNMTFLKQRIELRRHSDNSIAAAYKNGPRNLRDPFPFYPPEDVIYDTSPDWPYQHRAARHTKPGDVVLPARFFLSQLITKELRRHATLEVVFTSEDGKFRLQPAPKNLLGALWLQLARAVDGDHEYRRCRQCRDWFEVSLEASRRSREYCEDRCKFKAYRERQAEALKLQAEGRPLGVIANALDSRVDVVKRWIAKRPSGVRMTSRSIKVAKGSRRRPARRGGPN